MSSNALNPKRPRYSTFQLIVKQGVSRYLLTNDEREIYAYDAGRNDLIS